MAYNHAVCPILIILLSLIAWPSFGTDLHGRVVAIAGGNTVTLLTAKKQQVKIRLAEIDAPESGQP
jgi:endonuclease YncB( thermonuclease family)